MSVKIGFGIGDLNIIYVGGIFGRAEYLLAGDPLTQAFQCEHHSTKGRKTIVSQEVKKYVDDCFVFHKLEEGEFYFVEKITKGQKVRMKADALLIKNNVNLK